MLAIESYLCVDSNMRQCKLFHHASQPITEDYNNIKIFYKYHKGLPLNHVHIKTVTAKLLLLHVNDLFRASV